MTNDIHGSIRRSGPAWRASVAGRAPAAHCPKVRCRPLRRGHRLATNLRRMPRGVHLEGERFDEAQAFRSEEHTSELQSLMRISYAVFCLKQNKRVERADT